MSATEPALDLAAIKDRLEKATPGQWAVGERWPRTWPNQRMYGDGKCVNCDKYPLVGEFDDDYEGKMVTFHVHELPESLVDDYTEVFAFTGKTRPVMVVGLEGYGYEGGVLNPADADFIVHAREDIPALIAEVERTTALMADRAHTGSVPEFRFTDDQWRSYQSLTSKGYSHRHYLEYIFNQWVSDVEENCSSNNMEHSPSGLDDY